MKPNKIEVGLIENFWPLQFNRKVEPTHFDFGKDQIEEIESKDYDGPGLTVYSDEDKFYKLPEMLFDADGQESSILGVYVRMNQGVFLHQFWRGYELECNEEG